jgi:hypothetical protein
MCVARQASFLRCTFFKKICRKGAQARVDNSTKEQRQEWAKKAAAARWKKGASVARKRAIAAPEFKNSISRHQMHDEPERMSTPRHAVV